jgi:hypothetical protein
MRITGRFEATLAIGNSHSMEPFVPVLFAETQADFSTYRRHLSLNQLTKLRPAWRRSANQLEQLVGKQGNDAKHEMEPDFLGAPHHDVVTPKLFLQAAIKPLRHRAFLVSGRLMGRQRDNLSPPAILIDNGDVPQAAAHGVDRLGVVGRIHQLIQIIYPGAGQLHQWDGRLAVVQGGRGQRHADGQATVTDVGVTFKASPGLLIALGILLRPHTQCTGNSARASWADCRH